jgi:predicted DNA-binding transcriptional regulator AlpA
MPEFDFAREPRLLTTRHACERADVSRATLFRAARRGALHPVHLGQHFTRWSLDDIDAWINRAAGGSANHG